MTDGQADPDASATLDSSRSDASTTTGDAGSAALSGTGHFTASGAVGAPGTTAAPFTFDASVGGRVRMKYTQSGLPTSCGDVVLEYVGDHLTAEVVGCSSLQTIDVVFDLPLVTGSFPGEGSTSPRAMIQLSRASGTNHYVDQGSTSYGNRFENKGARLTVTRGPRTSAVDLAINLSGTVDVNAGACSQCTVGGPQITLDLDLALTNIPKP